MPIRIFNSLTRQKEDFQPINPPHVLFYACGPTVYGKFHMGNARTFVNTDVIRRWLVERGYQVQFVTNITDVDDKIIRKGAEEGVSADEIARRYTDYFFGLIERLGNIPATKYPKATEYIASMIGMIETLIARGHAYASDEGSVWFDVASFPEYGRLSRMPLDQMQQGERVDSEQQKLKKSPLDFALWKGAKAGEPAWQSPWGMGRPGWHIECSCMSMETLNAETIDIHSGGSDLRFPHHENEIAQSECATGKQFARYWIHLGMLDVEGIKMSKSLGNMKHVDDVMTVVDTLSLRYFLMSARYRDKIDYTERSIAQCESAVDRMKTAALAARRATGDGEVHSDWRQDPELNVIWDEFAEGMDDDFNTPRAIAAIARLVTLLNTRIANNGSKASIAAAASLLVKLRDVLGLSPKLERQVGALDTATLSRLRAIADEQKISADVDGEALIAALIDARVAAKKARNFSIADDIRKRMAEAGIALEDKPTGATWKRV